MPTLPVIAAGRAVESVRWRVEGRYFMWCDLQLTSMSATPEEDVTYLDDEGRPIEFHAYEEGDVREAKLSRDGDNLLLEVARDDETVESYEFEPLRKMFVGIEVSDGDRDDVPRDVLDALLNFGYAVGGDDDE